MGCWLGCFSLRSLVVLIYNRQFNHLLASGCVCVWGGGGDLSVWPQLSSGKTMHSSPAYWREKMEIDKHTNTHPPTHFLLSSVFLYIMWIEGLGDLQSMCLRHDLPFFFCAFVFLCFVLLLPLFLVGFISSLPPLAWDKRLSCCCCCWMWG
jgi:hypothetical protein